MKRQGSPLASILQLLAVVGVLVLDCSGGEENHPGDGGGEEGIEWNSCSVPGWADPNLHIDPLNPSGEMADVSSAGAFALFIVEPDVKLVFEGHLPMVRFMSFQSESINLSTLTPTIADALFDYEIEMDPGSINPFVPGAEINASPRNYNIEYLPVDAPRQAASVLRMGPDVLQHLELRFYAPDDGVQLTANDLPAVHAYDVSSGAPAPCPFFITMPTFPKTCKEKPPPATGPDIQFALSPITAGFNAAIPMYVLSEDTPMDPGQVAVVRYKAPTFVNTFPGTGTFPSGKDVRYWSISAMDPSNGWETFGGLPDYLAKMDDSGCVTIVIGPDSVASQAQLWGHNFIRDNRSSCANSVIFNIRNVLPSSEFWSDPEVYPLANWPTGRVCDASEYLAGICNP